MTLLLAKTSDDFRVAQPCYMSCPINFMCLENFRQKHSISRTKWRAEFLGKQPKLGQCPVSWNEKKNYFGLAVEPRLPR